MPISGPKPPKKYSYLNPENPNETITMKKTATLAGGKSAYERVYEKPKTKFATRGDGKPRGSGKSPRKTFKQGSWSCGPDGCTKPSNK